MRTGTAVLAKYLNGVAEENEGRKYRKLLVDNFKEVGMYAFGQLPLIVGNGRE